MHGLEYKSFHQSNSLCVQCPSRAVSPNYYKHPALSTSRMSVHLVLLLLSFHIPLMGPTLQMHARKEKRHRNAETPQTKYSTIDQAELKHHSHSMDFCPVAMPQTHALPPRCNRLAHFLKPRGFPATGAPPLVHVVVQVAGGSGGSGLFTSNLLDVDVGVEAVLVTECRGVADGDGDDEVV